MRPHNSLAFIKKTKGLRLQKHRYRQACTAKKKSRNEKEAYVNEIFKRISVRKFEDRPVEDEKLTQIMKAAMAAPKKIL